ncbi:MAG: RNA polymerase sigma factor RpoD/SigA [Treponema sp.]|jgi:RNA polymerase primary sigma factor|nr:RNA polymerase sigma factor RpoD/SigA [Treponema sp.]
MFNKTIKEDSLLDTYFKQIKVYPLLNFDEEQKLSKLIQNGDDNALHKLVNSNLRLAAKIAGSYNIPEIPVMDLIQEANMGLIQAAKKFDYRKNVKFCTYAGWWIRQFVSRFIVNKRRMVRLPQRKEDTFRRIKQTYNILCQSMMQQPQTADIAKELGLSVQYVDSIVNMTADSLPLELYVMNDENTGSMDVHEDYTYCPERNLLKQFSRDGTMNILNKLKERERRIISYRYQLNGCKRHTLREIGNKLNISPETVRQIELKALKKIRSHANELKECVYAV